MPERTVRSVVLRGGLLRVGHVPEPVPGPGQLLVAPIATGVCGSDLSAWQHTEDYLAAHLDAGMDGGLFDPDQDLVLGHEFTSRVVAVGDGVTGYAGRSGSARWPCSPSVRFIR